MGRMYVSNFDQIAVTAVVDFFEILAPSDSGIVIYGWELSQTTDVGDAAEELLDIETVYGIGSVTSGSGGSTATTNPVSSGDASTGATIERTNTTRMAAGTGSLQIHQKLAMNVRVAPSPYWYIPELRPVVSPGNRFTLSLNTAPADSLTFNGTIWFEETGG